MTDWNTTELTTDHALHRMADDADKLLARHEDFLDGDFDAIPEAELDDYVEETELTADLAGLEDALREIEDEYDEYSTSMDADAAIAVREHVTLTRAAASDSGIWHAFTMIYYPWFVTHRWEFTGVSAMKKKFWTQGRALDSTANTFERLWWIAELTRTTDSEGNADYTRTNEAFDKRRFVFRVFDIKMGRYKPAVEALVDVLYDVADEDDDEEGKLASGDVIDATIKQFRKSGSTLPYESQTKSNLVDTLTDIREDAEAEMADAE